ncbi:MAG: glycine cleavage system protein GcvH [Phycisphaerales bacterium]|nr:glycine cleavage system protein GcvH [Phycisphaerales bacterium]
MTTERRFSDSHEWFEVHEDVVTVGLTQYAVNELTDVTFVEMRPSGSSVSAGDAVGEVESVKTTSDVYSVIGGEIIEVNQAAIDDPALLNRDAAGEGWLVKIRTSDTSPIDALLDAATYEGRYPV